MSATARSLGSPVLFAFRTLIVLAAIFANLAFVTESSATLPPAIVPLNDAAVNSPVLGLYLSPVSVSIPCPPVAPSTNVIVASGIKVNLPVESSYPKKPFFAEPSYHLKAIPLSLLSSELGAVSPPIWKIGSSIVTVVLFTVVVVPLTTKFPVTVAFPVTVKREPSNVRLASSTNALVPFPVNTLLFVKVEAPVPPCSTARSVPDQLALLIDESSAREPNPKPVLALAGVVNAHAVPFAIIK